MAEWISKTLGELTSFISKGIPPKYVDEETIRTLKLSEGFVGLGKDLIKYENKYSNILENKN